MRKKSTTREGCYPCQWSDEPEITGLGWRSWMAQHLLQWAFRGPGILQTSVHNQTAVNSLDHPAERFLAHLLGSEKPPLPPPSQVVRCAVQFPIITGGITGWEREKRKGKGEGRGEEERRREKKEKGGRKGRRGEQKVRERERGGKGREERGKRGRERERQTERKEGMWAKCMAFKWSSFQKLWLGCRFAESLDP